MKLSQTLESEVRPTSRLARLSAKAARIERPQRGEGNFGRSSTDEEAPYAGQGAGSSPLLVSRSKPACSRRTNRLRSSPRNDAPLTSRVNAV